MSGLPEPADIPAHFQTFLAFDYGLKRTGVASGSRLLRTATPQRTIRADGAEARLAEVEARVREWQPDALVVGVPFHPDGASHDNTARARRFADTITQAASRYGRRPEAVVAAAQAGYTSEDNARTARSEAIERAAKVALVIAAMKAEAQAVEGAAAIRKAAPGLDEGPVRPEHVEARRAARAPKTSST